MKKKLALLTLSMVLAVSTLAGCASSSSTSSTTSSTDTANTETISLRMAQASAADGAIGISMEAFADMVKEKTNGGVEITVYHNGQLGTERDNVEGCQLNNLDIAVVNNSIVANFIPWFSAFDLPYVIENTEHADKVFLGDVGDDMLSAMDEIGIKGIGIWESGFRNLTNSKKEVNTVQDVSGLRIRVMENRVHQALWMALGADPAPMAWGDAYTAMQQGAIDGQENPTTVIDKNNVVEVNKNLAITEHVYSTVSVIMSPSAWAKLGEEYQAIFMECMEAVELSERELSREMDVQAVEDLQGKGMVVTYPDKTDFISLTQSVRDEYGSDYAEILDRVAATK